MKKIFFLLCILFPFLSSCEDQLGGQTDPKLNISEYTFSKEGGHLEVYSTLDYHLAILRPYECEDSTVVSGEKYGVPFVKSDWFEVSFMTGDYKKYGWLKIISIDVEPNETGEERTIPVEILYRAFDCKVNYKQAAE